MISVELLKKSIYSDCYFSENVGSLTVRNEDRITAGTLAYIDMISKGRFINLSNNLLKDSSNIFRKGNKEAGHISYRKDCDGVCLLEVEGRNILLFIEVKSGFREVKKKAFEQLVSSYIKVKCMLQTIEGYNPSDYEELGLVVSYPPFGLSSSISSTSLITTKKAAIAPSPLDKLNNANSTKLRVDKEVTLSLRDYKVNECYVNPLLYSETLHVKHISVTDQVSSEVINLDDYL